MRGKTRRISAPRRLIADLMHASQGVPLISYRRTLHLGPLARARAAAASPPGFAAIFAKAFSLVARDEPVLRTLYIAFPWPHFFEVPKSVGMIAVARRIDGEDCVLMQKVTAADTLPLPEVDAIIRSASTAPIETVPMFRKLLRISRMPWPLRRIAWWAGMSLNRPRANFFGSFGLSSVSAFGPGDLYPVSPGPYILSYGRLADDGRLEVIVRFDHRVIDAAPIARLTTRLEQVLNTTITAEIERLDRPARALRAAAGP
ncbi:acyltransferase [Rhodopseudomonas palustris]|uniref:acyltransferase n=1 Tax=Rhodopseudomonas palustris TaxID=1076 RepID=UPI000D1BE617|nr:acyltransferase [Rhodopseudomonas palustris]AVT75624.1 acyltransferase [Rhodopseudomonas palustris]